MTIQMHWTSVLILALFYVAALLFKRDHDTCGAFGIPTSGIFAVLMAVIMSMALLLVRAWGWV